MQHTEISSTFLFPKGAGKQFPVDQTSRSSFQCPPRRCALVGTLTMTIRSKHFRAIHSLLTCETSDASPYLLRSGVPIRISPIFCNSMLTLVSHSCVNHLIVGNIGQHEIILLATDDGDVLVYYTHLFQAEIKSDLGLARSSKSSGTRP